MDKLVVTTKEQLIEMLKQVGDLYSFDTETTGLNYYKLDMLGWSMSNDNTAYYCPLNICENKKDLIAILKEHIEWNTKALIMHNAPYDLMVLDKVGINYEGPLFCTMTAAHLLNENRSVGLKELAVEELNAGTFVKFFEASEAGVNTQQFYDYAINDAIFTWQLFKKFKDQLKKQNLEKLFYQIEMPFQYVVKEMNRDGVKVDLEKVEQLRKDVKSKLNEILIEMCKLAGKTYVVEADLFEEEVVKPEVNFGSTKQVAPILESFGFEVPKTKKGNPSLNKESIAELPKHPFIDLFKQFKIGNHCMNNFILKLPKLVDEDGRVRPSFNNTACSTGRLSCSDPNLQQNPKSKDEFPIDFRSVFIAEEGYSLLTADYGGQELTVAAHIAKDQVMIKALKENYDLHLITANTIYVLGIPEPLTKKDHLRYKEICEKYEKERYEGKNEVNFPILYGKTDKGLAKSLKRTEKEAKEILSKFFNKYRGIKDAIKLCSQQLEQYGYVRTLVGRYRRLNPKFQKSHRQAFNFKIQGLCADMIRLAMIRIRKYIKDNPQFGATIIMTVHDEVVLQVKDEYVEVVKVEVIKIMESVFNLLVPITVEVGVGKNYGEAK